MLDLCNNLALGIIIGLLFSFLMAWFGSEKGENTIKQTTCKIFIGVIVINLIFIVIFQSTSLAIGFTLATTLICAKMFPNKQ